MTTDTLLLPATSILPPGSWRPPRRGPRATPLALAAGNLLAVLVAAWSLTRPLPEAPPAVLPLPAPPPPVAAPLPEPLVLAEPAPPLAPGAAWMLDEVLPRLESRLDATGHEIQDLVDAVLGLRKDSALLAEDGQLAHERLKALEERLARGRGTRAKPAAPPPAAAPAPSP
jgi:hypothetical protein